MKKALFFTIIILLQINFTTAQSCLGDAGFPWLCLANNRTSGDVIQMSYVDFSNPTVIAGLYTETPANKCNDNMKVIIIRRLHDEETTNNVAVARSVNNDDNPCYKKLVFAGTDFDPCYEINSCNDSLILYVEITGGTVGFTPPPSAIIPCGYDKDTDPLNLIGFPSNVSGGVISYTDNGATTPCTGTTNFTRTWTITACSGTIINKTQTITVLAVGCSFNTQTTVLNFPVIPPGDYYASNNLITDGKSLSNNSVNLFAQQSITLEAGFYAVANTDFTAVIATCSTIPANDVCTAPTPLICGESVFGNTLNATNTGVGNFDTTCNEGDLTANTLEAGHFFSLKGTGKTIKISANNDYTNFDTELRIYTGNCSTNSCITGNDDVVQGNTKSEVIFFAEADVDYLIYLDGYAGAVGNYELKVACFEGKIITCGEITGSTYGLDNKFNNYYYDTFSCDADDYNGKDIGYLWYFEENSTISISNLQFPGLTWFLLELDDNFIPTSCITPLDGEQANVVDVYSPGYHAIIIDAADTNVEGCFVLNIDCPAPVPLNKKSEEPILAASAPLLTDNSLIAKNISLALFPNPTAIYTTLSYNLPSNSAIKVTLFDLTGKALKTLYANSNQSAGHHQMDLAITDYPSGIYFVDLEVEGVHIFEKLIIQ